jgi:hypothetical protein
MARQDNREKEALGGGEEGKWGIPRGTTLLCLGSS